MKFLCDVHIPIRLSKHIVQLGFECEHVNNILNKWNTKDEDMADFVDRHNVILITKDQDFRNSFLLHHTPNKLIKINLGNISNEELLEVFTRNIDEFNQIFQENKAFMVEVNTDGFLTVSK